MIYVVLGMHKSGTTLVSQILHHSGINMDDDIDVQISYNEGNKYERQSILAVNMAILSAHKGDSFNLDSGRVRRIVKNQRANIQDIVQRCNERYPNWGFKDPRTCLMYPLWAPLLQEHKIITIYRLPQEVWPHFRPKSPYNQYRQLYEAWKFIKKWYQHNASIITYLQHAPIKYLVMDYRRLMTTQTEFDRLQDFIGIKLKDQRRLELYHNHLDEPFSLKLAAWLVEKQTGHHPRKIIEQFEALR